MDGAQIVFPLLMCPLETNETSPERGGLGMLCFSQLSKPCDTISENQNVKEKRLNLAHGFRGFSSWLLLQGKNIMVEGHGGAKLLRSWRSGSRAENRARREGKGLDIDHKVTLQDQPNTPGECFTAPWRDPKTIKLTIHLNRHRLPHKSNATIVPTGT